MTAARHSRITLSAALLLGVALGLAGLRKNRQYSASATEPAEEVAAAALTVPPPAPATGRESPAAAAYSAAWELLKDGKLRREERRAIQCDLLEEWCKIDLRAALHAAFEEDEVTDEDPFADPFAPSPYDACSDEIRSQLDLVWELVESREYGLHTRKLRTAWITESGYQNPLKLLDHFPRLPAGSPDRDEDPRVQAVQMALAGSIDQSDDPMLTNAVLDKLVVLAADGERERIVSAAAEFLPLWIPEERHLEFLRGATSPVAREIHVRAYASLVQVYLNHGKVEKLDEIPAEFRAEVMSRLASDKSGPVELPLPPGE